MIPSFFSQLSQHQTASTAALRRRTAGRRISRFLAEAMEPRMLLTASLTISDATLLEGDSGAANMQFTVSRGGDTASTITVGYTTADGTAIAGQDYTAQTGAVTIPAGAATADILIPVIGNTVYELDKTFAVQLTGIVDVTGASPSFTPPQTFGSGATDSRPQYLAAGDLNGDGRPDLVIPNSNGDTGVLVNSTAPGAASPTFESLQLFLIGVSPYAAVLADFNGDGRLDLALSNWGDNSVSVLLNTTPVGSNIITFAPHTTFAAGAGNVTLVAGDLNGDGLVDLATVGYSDNRLAVLLNTTAVGASTPSFAPAAFFDVPTNPYGVALGDLNGDGRLDLAICGGNNDTGSSVSVFLNTTAPGAGVPSLAARQDWNFSNSLQPRTITMGDFNSDGRLDLAVGASFGSGIAVFANNTPAGNATAVLAPPQSFSTPTGVWSLKAADINNDGRTDLAVGCWNAQAVYVMANTTVPGAATTSFAVSQPLVEGITHSGLAVADLNGDGRNDLAAINYFQDTVSILLNTTPMPSPDAGFGAAHDIPTGVTAANLTSVATGDLNGDGRPDVVAGNGDANNISVLMNTTPAGATAPVFATGQTIATGDQVTGIAIADLNGDGRDDIAAVDNANDASAWVLLNTTTPGAMVASFAAAQAFAAGHGARGIALGDVNGDGRPDLAIASTDDNTVNVLLNATAPGATIAAFLTQQSFATGEIDWGVILADVTGDGKLDIISADRVGNTLSILGNTTAPGSDVASFSPGQALATAPNPLTLAAADFNGDGRADIGAVHINGASVTILLSEPATIATASATGTIINDDLAPTVQFASASQSGPETGGALTITVQLSGASTLATIVPFILTGTAVNPTNYTIDASPITIPAGVTSATITIHPVDDHVHDTGTNVVVTLGTPTNATLGTSTIHTATITDNNPAQTPLIRIYRLIGTKANAVLSGQSTKINFGTVKLKSTGPAIVFRITNTGTVPLTLGSIRLPTGFKLAKKPPATLAAGKSTTFSVQLLTSSIGTKQGTILLTTNDLARNPFRIPIVGVVKKG